MDDRAEALLREVVTNPADDAPRLAFARHIESRAPAHAALIVAQCAGTATRDHLRAFEAELPALLREVLADSISIDFENEDGDGDGNGDGEMLLEPAPGEEEMVGFRHPVRGFFAIRGWRFEHRDFVAIDPDVLRRLAPACTSLTLDDVTDIATASARIRHFDVLTIRSTYIDSDVVKRLAATGAHSHLRELHFDAAWCDDSSLAALYDTLPALERLDLYVARRGDNASLLSAVGRTACARSVRALTVRGHDKPILDLRGFTTLRDVNATNCLVDDQLGECASRFHALWLANCDITTSFRAALNEMRVLGRLRELHLISNTSQREALLGMLASPGFGPLRALTIHDNEPEDEYIVQSLGNVERTLEQLHLGILLGDTGLRTLAAVPFTRLAWLQIDAPLTPDAARALATTPWIRNLRAFTFDVSLLDEGSATALAGALPADCQKTLHGDSYEEVFDAFGVTSEDIVDDHA